MGIGWISEYSWFMLRKRSICGLDNQKCPLNFAFLRILLGLFEEDTVIAAAKPSSALPAPDSPPLFALSEEQVG